ncbi:hypothetical protein [Gimesia algae]|uniref:Uncharacterized protein n=1 Tax=Gimesia algae TaxID=2527971 RepID=A0A517VCK3_9PLAN|nr:hypothetical protein [Gimesia algae]QDT90735.1 hypothetical protein Pan161_23880 [Gimesia algae]
MKRVQQIQFTRSQANARRGVITPLAAIVLLVVMTGIALIVNRLWLDAASLEVTTCVETAALAAGHELVSDELLKEKPDFNVLMERAESTANQALKLNTVAGHRIGINLTKGDNLLFGKLVPNEETGLRKFLETDHEPESIQIKTHNSSRLANPVADFMADLTRTNLGRTGAQIEATLDNHVIGVRPFENVPVPAYPLAILKNDPTGKHTETWELQINQKRGKDKYRFDPETKTVSRGSDGIPEIILTGKPRRGEITDANLQLLDFGSDLKSEPIVRQILSGLTRNDLKHFHGELLFNGTPLPVHCSPDIEYAEQDAFQDMVGQCRICFLYEQVTASSQKYDGTADCTNLVAGRIMAVQRADNQTTEIILQPAVITTRTVILAKPETDPPADQSKSDPKQTADTAKPVSNKYIYKLYLTR